MKKKGALEWEYLAAIILILLVIVLGLMFLKFGHETITEKASEFFKGFLKSLGR